MNPLLLLPAVLLTQPTPTIPWVDRASTPADHPGVLWLDVYPPPALGDRPQSANATLIDGNRILTSRHVVDVATRVVANLGERGSFEVTTVLLDDPDNDLVVLHADLPPDLTNLPLAPEPPRSRHHAIHIPSWFRGESFAVAHGNLTGRSYESDGTFWLWADSESWIGASGAGVRDTHNRIVGVLSRGGSADSGTYISPAFLIADRLDDPSDDQAFADWRRDNAASSFRQRSLESVRELMNAADHHAALQLLDAAGALDPEDDEVWSLKLTCLLATHQFPAANEHTRALLEAHPDNPVAHVLRGRLLLSTRDFEQSAASFRRAVELNPTVSGWIGLADALARASRPLEAAAALNSAIDLDPQNLNAYNRAINDLTRLENRPAAVSLARRAVDRVGCPASHAMLAFTLAQSGDHDAAHAALDHMTALFQGQPVAPTTYGPIAAAFAIMREPDKARHAADILLREFEARNEPVRFSTADHLARLFAGIGDHQAAVQWATLALRDGRNDATPLVNILSRSGLALNDPTPSIDALRAFRLLQPHNLAAVDALGRLLWHTHDFEGVASLVEDTAHDHPQKAEQIRRSLRERQAAPPSPP